MKMKVYYCNPRYCTKKETCSHYLMANKKFEDKILIGEDLYDVCDGGRLYSEDYEAEGYPSKAYYKELLKFYDTECPGYFCEHCQHCDCKNGGEQRKRPCICGDEFDCPNPLHPDNIRLKEIMDDIESASEVEEEISGTIDEVIVSCPICGYSSVYPLHTKIEKGIDCPICGYPYYHL